MNLSKDRFRFLSQRLFPVFVFSRFDQAIFNGKIGGSKNPFLVLEPRDTTSEVLKENEKSSLTLKSHTTPLSFPADTESVSSSMWCISPGSSLNQRKVSYPPIFSSLPFVLV